MILHKRLGPLLLGLLLALVSVTSAVAMQSRPSSSEPAQLVLKLKPGVTVEAVYERFDGFASKTVKGKRTRAYSDAPSIASITYTDEQAAMRALAQLKHHPDVLIAELEQGRQLYWEPENEPDYELQREWVEQVDLPGAWNTSTGNDSIVVAIVDSGVSPTHPDLVGKLVSGRNAVDGDDDWADNNGHGTHVAGIIVANGSNEIGTAGAAMDTMLMPIRVLDENNYISTASIAAGIIWAVTNGADVINLSLGASTPSKIEQDAVRFAYSSGVPVLAASGNFATRISYPASYPEAISVGALDSEGNKARFSSVISEVDVAAPGELIYSPHWDTSVGDGWTNILNNQPVSGTSFAVAIVSGVTALMRSVDNNLGPEEVRELLMATATDSGEPGNEAGVGAGQIDAEAAVRAVAFSAMYDTWFPADNPVAAGAVQRTWLWGQDPPPYHSYEPYAEAQHGIRIVYYYDKSRMEVTNPFDDREASWYVTNGLLVNELISGRIQVGDGEFIDQMPAEANVAGDPDDTLGPTYATFANVLDTQPLAEDLPISQTITREGVVGSDALLISYGVVGDYLDPTTGHRIANVFWDYLNSTGPVASDEGLIEDQLFDPWFFATGLPITEAYWAKVKVADVVQDVLMQCFERRCLTYTPANPLAWRVEMGNVGLHYYAWRYGGDVEPPVVEPPVEPPETPEPPGAGDALFIAGFEDLGSATIDEGSRTIVEEGYLLDVDVQDFEIGVLVPQLILEDVIVRSTVRVLSEDGTGSYCLVARRLQQSGDRYQACLGANGDVSLVFSSAAGAEILILLEATVDASAMANGVELALFVSGSNLWLEIDGEIVGTASHSGASAGSVGLMAVGEGIFLVTNFAVFEAVSEE